MEQDNAFDLMVKESKGHVIATNMAFRQKRREIFAGYVAFLKDALAGKDGDFTQKFKAVVDDRLAFWAPFDHNTPASLALYEPMAKMAMELMDYESACSYAMSIVKQGYADGLVELDDMLTVKGWVSEVNLGYASFYTEVKTVLDKKAYMGESSYKDLLSGQAMSFKSVLSRRDNMIPFVPKIMAIKYISAVLQEN